MNTEEKEKLSKALLESATAYLKKEGQVYPVNTGARTASKAVWKIEAMMRKLIQSKDIHFRVETELITHKKIIIFTEIGKCLLSCLKSQLFQIKEQFPIHRFNPYVDLFLHHVKNDEFNPIKHILSAFANDHSVRFSNNAYDDDDVIMAVKHMNQVIETIRQQACDSVFKKVMSDHMRSPNKNHKNLVVYIDDIIKEYSRLVIERVDLGYLKECGWPNGISGMVTPTEFLRHKEMLIDFLHKKMPEKSLIGYVWKCEYGLDKSFHIHLLVFLNGSLARQDVTIAKIIGQYWDKEITRGKGLHYNCNANKSRYGIKCAIGVIKWENTEAHEILKTNIALYLTKLDYYIKLLLPNNARTFGKGHFPKPRISKRGRPRSIQSSPALNTDVQTPMRTIPLSHIAKGLQIRPT